MNINDNVSFGEQIIVGATTSLVTEAIRTGWDKVRKFFKDLDAKDSIRYGTAYSDYLKNTFEKNSKIKTLIYRRVPKNLYSFYESVGVRYKDKTIDTSDIQNLIKVCNKIVITGTGGIGKSILLKHLFLNTIQNTENIPILIELRKFNNIEAKEISLYNAIYQSLSDNGFQLEDEYFSYSLEEGGYIILLDGFDEVNRDRVSKISEEIKSFSGKYNKNKFIVSSRPADYFIGWNDYHEMTACNLTKEQALSLIKKIEFDETVKKVFFDALDKDLFERYYSFASNPLLLTIMLLTFNNHASIPEKLNDFYEEAFSTLFDMHDATKDCYERDIRSNLGLEDFKTVFSYICFKSYFRGDYEFSEFNLHQYIQEAKDKFENIFFNVDDFQEDLTLSVCMLVKDGLNYRFTHRSFQEYFAARYTCKLTDDLQQKLLTSWLSESLACLTDEYMQMLFNLQSEKVNKVIFCPGLKTLESLYKENGFSYELLYKMFEGVSITKNYFEENNERKGYYAISLDVKDYYLCNILRLVCGLNRYPYPQKPELDSRAQEILFQIVVDTKVRLPYRWTFDEILSVINSEDLLYCLNWVHKHLQFAFNIYEKYKESSALKKRKVSSIIDEL